MNHLQRIRAEFGKPPSEVIRDFALKRNSRERTAQRLGIDRSTLMTYARRFEVDHLFVDRSRQRRESKGGHPKGQPGKVRYQDEELLAMVRTWPTVEDFTSNAKASIWTIRYRFGSFSMALRLALEWHQRRGQ